jgi:putative glutamine amidotransferase
VHRERPGTFTEHDVRLADGSRIADIYGTTTLSTNSSHHQGVQDPGTLAATGWTDDGLIEVLEAPDARFAVGVQWHPEHPDRRSAELPLFRAFIGAATTT